MCVCERACVGIMRHAIDMAQWLAVGVYVCLRATAVGRPLGCGPNNGPHPPAFVVGVLIYSIRRTVAEKTHAPAHTFHRAIVVIIIIVSFKSGSRGVGDFGGGHACLHANVSLLPRYEWDIVHIFFFCGSIINSRL